MAQPITRSAIGATAETAESGVGGGILGGLAGILGGGLLGAAAVAVVGAAVLGAVGLVGGAVLGFFGLAEGAAAGMAVMAKLGAIGGSVVGGIGGAYYGGIAGGVIGAVKGVAGKASSINADERMANSIKKSKQVEQMQQMAAIREQAADQYTRVGYEQGARDAQVAIMQQLQQAAIAQQQAEQNKPGFVDKLAKERGVDKEQLTAASHADQAKASKEAADHQALGA